MTRLIDAMPIKSDVVKCHKNDSISPVAPESRKYWQRYANISQDVFEYFRG